MYHLGFIWAILVLAILSSLVLHFRATIDPTCVPQWPYMRTHFSLCMTLNLSTHWGYRCFFAHLPHSRGSKNCAPCVLAGNLKGCRPEDLAGEPPFNFDWFFECMFSALKMRFFLCLFLWWLFDCMFSAFIKSIVFVSLFAIVSAVVLVMLF